MEEIMNTIYLNFVKLSSIPFPEKKSPWSICIQLGYQESEDVIIWQGARVFYLFPL